MASPTYFENVNSVKIQRIIQLLHVIHPQNLIFSFQSINLRPTDDKLNTVLCDGDTIPTHNMRKQKQNTLSLTGTV